MGGGGILRQLVSSKASSTVDLSSEQLISSLEALDSRVVIQRPADSTHYEVLVDQDFANVYELPERIIAPMRSATNAATGAAEDNPAVDLKRATNVGQTITYGLIQAEYDICGSFICRVGMQDFEIRLFYVPQQDVVLIFNASEPVFQVVHMEDSSSAATSDQLQIKAEKFLGKNASQSLTKGLWRIHFTENASLLVRVLSTRQIGANMVDKSTSVRQRLGASRSESSFASSNHRLVQTTSEISLSLDDALWRTGSEVHLGGAPSSSYSFTTRRLITTLAHSRVITACFKEPRPGMYRDEEVVIKVVRTDRGPQDAQSMIEIMKSFQREVKYLSKASKKARAQHVVAYLGHDARYMGIFLRYIPGNDLSQLKDIESRCTLSTLEAWTIMIQISLALADLHRSDIIHCDIKPANILIHRTGANHIKSYLCDFGFAQGANEGKTTGGTPWYIPMEFLLKEEQRAPGDVWALGVTMLYAFGYLPLPGVNAHKTGKQHHYWLISKLNDPRDTAAKLMTTWINQLEQVVDGLTENEGSPDKILKGMLAKKSDRLIAEQVWRLAVNQLPHDQREDTPLMSDTESLAEGMNHKPG